MPVEDFADLMQSTALVERLVEMDSDNQPVYESPQEMRCRIAHQARMGPALGAPGRQVMTRGTVWFMANSGVDESSRITLPDGEVLNIAFVERPRDETGEVHHIKVTFT